MIYANDAWVQLPVKDLYDSQMMLASVEAAKDMYDKRAKAMDDFYKNYGDFQSPFSKDMEEYANMINRPADIINKLYENGIDPLRSAEGAAVVQQAIRQFSIPTYNQMKANAALGYEYLKSISSLEEAGKFNLDREVWELKRRGIIPQDAQINDKNQLLGYFSSVGDKGYNQWGKLAGTPNISAHDVFAPLVDDLKPHDLSNDEALKEFGLNEIPGYYWTDAITPSDIRNTLAVNIPGISNTADYQYLLHTVGGDYNKLLDYATNSVREYIRNPKKTADEGYWREWQFKKDMQKIYATAAAKNSGNKNPDDEEKPKNYYKDLKYRLQLGVTNLLRGTTAGNAFKIADPKYFDEQDWGALVPGAQQEIANNIYSSSLDRYDVTTSNFTKSYFDQNGELVFGRPQTVNYSIKATSTDDQFEDLRKANKKMLDRLTITTSPSALASTLNREVSDKDKNMIYISNDYDILSSLYTTDEVASNLYGVDVHKDDLQKFETNGESVRGTLQNDIENNGSHVYMKGRGKQVSGYDKNGIFAMWELVDIYKKTATSGANDKGEFTKQNNIGTLLLKLPAQSYENKAVNSNPASSANLFIDPLSHGYSSLNWNFNAGKSLGSTGSEVKNTPIYPILYP